MTTERTFPPEIIDLIIQQNHSDFATLKSCSLSSRSCLKSSQQHLFHTISITEALSSHRGPNSRAEEFASFWISSSHLREHIKILRISWSPPNDLKELDVLLKPFQDLSIPIQLLTSSRVDDGLTEIVQYLTNSGLATRVTHIRSEEESLVSPALFSAFPNLKVLSLLDTSGFPEDDDLIPVLDRFPPQTMVLDEFEIKSNTSGETILWFEHSISTSKLRAIRYTQYAPESGFMTTAVKACTPLLLRVALTLQVLGFEPSLEEFNGYPAYNPCFSSLAQFPQLRKIVLYCRNVASQADFFKWAYKSFAELPEKNFLNEIILDFPRFNGKILIEEDDTAEEGHQPFQRNQLVNKVLANFLESKRLGISQERQKARESISGLDQILAKFVNLQRFCVVSRASTLLREKFVLLRKRGILFLYPASDSSLDAFSLLEA